MLLNSKLLQEKINKIINIDRSNFFILSCIFKSEIDPSYKLEIDHIDNLKIEENFSSNFIDNILLYAKILPNDLMELLEQKESIYCILKIEYIDFESGRYILDEDPEIYKYKVFISNQSDINKQLHESAYSQVHEEETPKTISQYSSLIPIVFQLMEDKAYDLHKQQVTGIFPDNSIEQILKFITKLFGIDKISIHPVENVFQFTNFIIPPEYSRFDIIFNYIQKRYGIYNSGLSYYYFKKTLYIYPEYYTNINTDNVINIFKATDNSYLGLKNYHDEYEKDNIKYLDIVNSHKLISKRIDKVGLENVGTNIVFIKADHIIDKTYFLKNDKFTIDDENSITFSSTLEDTIMKSASVPSYKEATINYFEKLSQLESFNAEIISLDWLNCRLFKIAPGTSVKLYFDKDEVISIKGIISSVKYDVIKQRISSNKFIFSAIAYLVIRFSIPKK